MFLPGLWVAELNEAGYVDLQQLSEEGPSRWTIPKRWRFVLGCTAPKSRVLLRHNDGDRSAVLYPLFLLDLATASFQGAIDTKGDGK